MKRFPFSLLFVCLLVGCPHLASAERLNVVTVALPPYGYVEQGEPVGLTYDIGDALTEEAGYKPNNRIVPLARAMSLIEAGTADIVIMFPNPDIEQAAENLGLVLEMETVVLGRADTRFRSLRDVRGKILASVRGARYDARISKKNGMVVYPTESYSQSLKMLMAGRVDGVVGPRLGLFFAAREVGVPAQAFNEPLHLSQTRSCLFLSKRSATPEKRKRLQKALDRLRSGSDLERLKGNYSL